MPEYFDPQGPICRPPTVRPIVPPPRPQEPPAASRARRLLGALCALFLGVLLIVPPALICARFWPVAPQTRARIVELLDASPDFRQALIERDLGGPHQARIDDGRLILRREWPYRDTFSGTWLYQPEDGSPRVSVVFRVDLAHREVAFHPAHA